MSLPLFDATQNSDLFYKQHHDCPVFKSDDPVLMKLWHYLCQRARLYPGEIQWNRNPLRLGTGQLIFGRFKASSDLNISEWKIRDRVSRLINMGLIHKISVKNGKRGYSIYQLTHLVNRVSLEQNSPTLKVTPPQTKNQHSKPASEKLSSTKKKNKPLKEKTYKKRKVPLSNQITMNDVCLSNPIILKNDKHALLKRFGEDFLKFLIEKARQYAKDPSNPIGLLIHMLRTGSYAGQYADIQKQRAKSQARLEAIQREKKEEEEARRVKAESRKVALEQALVLIQADFEFRTQVKDKIFSTMRFMKTFLRPLFPEGFTVDDVLENQRALAYYSEPIFELIQSRHQVSS